MKKQIYCPVCGNGPLIDNEDNLLKCPECLELFDYDENGNPYVISFDEWIDIKNGNRFHQHGINGKH